MQNSAEIPASVLTITDTDMEKIRRQHIVHETAIKFIGVLFLLFGVLYIPLFLLFLLGMMMMHHSGWDNPYNVVLFVSVFIILPLPFWAGYTMFQLKPGAKIPVILLGVLLSLFFPAFEIYMIPVALFIGLYIVYMLLCKKGRYILSEDYTAIIEQTPHIEQDKTLIIASAVLALFIVLFVITAIIV